MIRIDKNSLSWLMLAIGLGLLYIPSIWDLMHGIWTSDQQGHAPMLLAVVIWLIGRQKDVLLLPPLKPNNLVGWPAIVIGLTLYVIGRSQGILLFEIASIIWIIAGLTALMLGIGALKKIAFPLFLLIFILPLPGAFIDAVTQPMKIAVSAVVEHLLYFFDYPISRNGVVLQIGQYQLLVADACAGLHTFFTLEALGLLYINLVRHSSVLRNILLGILIIPISFTANVLRVTTLTLITYHFGDAAGQGFLHGFAGIVLFMAALLLIILVDSLLRFTVGKHQLT